MKIESTPSMQAKSKLDEKNDLTSRLVENESDDGGPLLSKDAGPSVNIGTFSYTCKNDSQFDIDSEKISEIQKLINLGELTMNIDKISQALLEETFYLIMRKYHE